MLFEPQYEKYEGEDLSELIGDEWKIEKCDCHEVKENYCKFGCVCKTNKG